MAQGFGTVRRTTEGVAVSAPGLLHTVSVSGLTASPTAGLLTIYDNTAESGTVLYSEWVFATVVGHTITLDSQITTGVYIGFDAALANISVTVTYQ